MSSENGKTVFEEAAAERELEELRRAIEESRGRRRRANEAFDEFLKGFDARRRAARCPLHNRRDRRSGEPERSRAAAPNWNGCRCRRRASHSPNSAEGPAAPAEPPRPKEPNDEGSSRSRPRRRQPPPHGGAAAPAHIRRSTRSHTKSLRRELEVDPGGADPSGAHPPGASRRRRDCGRGSARGVSLVARPLPGRSCLLPLPSPRRPLRPSRRPHRRRQRPREPKRRRQPRSRRSAASGCG